MNTSEKKEDLRIKRTYKLLSKALMELLEEKSINEIHVSDICDRAMIHRSTFYKHFEDKYHLFEFTVISLQDEFIKRALSEDHSDNPIQFFMNLLKHVIYFQRSNKKISLLILGRDENNLSLIKYHNTIAQGIQNRLEEFQKNGVTFSVPLPLLANYHAGAFIAIQRWWLENNIPISKEDFLSYVNQLIGDVTGNISK